MNGDIECGNGFIRNNQLGIQRQSPRNPDPLALSSGKFVRIAVCKARVKADFRQQLLHSLVPLAHAVHMVSLERLFNNGTQRFPRVKGCEGILEDHLDVFADAFSQLFFR